MKISKLALATLVPATAAGVVLTAVPFAQAAPAAPVAHTAASASHTATPAAHTAPLAVHHMPPAKPKPHRARHHKAHHAHHSATATTPAQASTAGQPITAGMSSFEQCVAWRESGDNPVASSAGLFGILPSTWAPLGYSGTAGQASVALQKVAFTRLYAEYGAQPWAPSDGC